MKPVGRAGRLKRSILLISCGLTRDLLQGPTLALIPPRLPPCHLSSKSVAPAQPKTSAAVVPPFTSASGTVKSAEPATAYLKP